MREDRARPELATGQLLHGICLAALLAATWVIWSRAGRPHPGAFWTAVAVPVAHQVFVWLCWRIELRWSAVSDAIGFRGYLVPFFLLFVGRFVAVLVLCWVDRGSLGIGPVPRSVVTVLLLIPSVYLFYSVQRWFGMTRAAGADHFDPRYRDLPLVREGIFRFARNGMYVFGFLPFWAMAIGFASKAGLIVAAFSHLYIWVHYLATERPDMRFLYG